MHTMTLRPALERALAPFGLQLRGAFAVRSDDGLAPLPDGQPVASVWLVGVVGSTFWPYFEASPLYADGLPDPLDRWSKSIGDALADQLGGRAVYPSDGPPYHPFQQWAERAEALQTSPMMLRMHPQYGLWHAYRFALALAQPVDGTRSALIAAVANPTICATCDGQPCLRACPVGAYAGAGFEMDACSGHVHSSAGQHCMQTGCQARLACPVGREHRYQTEHAAFHMRAFADRH